MKLEAGIRKDFDMTFRISIKWLKMLYQVSSYLPLPSEHNEFCIGYAKEIHITQKGDIDET
eukprot:snap_masked-scaffold_80-processed-gene-0.7-mRNA-1 protein AED:1.00 eAED:1.00 QI:0/0/0/0/1/1/2/0/60